MGRENDHALGKARLALLHVPKTAGTSLANALFEACEPGEILTDFRRLGTNALGHVLKREMERFMRELSPDQIAKCRILSGHLPFGFDAGLGFPFTYGSMFRHPVSRLFSGFFYGSSATLAGRDADYLVFGLHRSLSIGASPGFHNPLTRILTGSEVLAPPEHGATIWDLPPLTVADRDLAIGNLRSRFGFVGVTERFDESCKLLFSLLRKPYGGAKMLNRTANSVPSDVIPWQTLRLAARRLRHDITVYDAACELYDEAARRAGLRLASARPPEPARRGALSSGDYAHTTSAEHAFGDDPHSAWLSFAQYRERTGEYLGWDFGEPFRCERVQMQLVYPRHGADVAFALEASNDEFARDVRQAGVMQIPADCKLHALRLAGHIVASAWRVRRLGGGADEPLAVASLAFHGGEAPRRDVVTVLETLGRTVRTFRGEKDDLVLAVGSLA
jgi:hypothetical protein